MAGPLPWSRRKDWRKHRKPQVPFWKNWPRANPRIISAITWNKWFSDKIQVSKVHRIVVKYGSAISESALKEHIMPSSYSYYFVWISWCRCTSCGYSQFQNNQRPVLVPKEWIVYKLFGVLFSFSFRNRSNQSKEVVTLLLIKCMSIYSEADSRHFWERRANPDSDFCVVCFLTRFRFFRPKFQPEPSILFFHVFQILAQNPRRKPVLARERPPPLCPAILWSIAAYVLDIITAPDSHFIPPPVPVAAL